MIRTFSVKLLSLAMVLSLLAQVVYTSPLASASEMTDTNGEGLTLVSNHQSESAIIWWSRDGESQVASFAAEEIHNYVKLMSNTDIPVYEGALSSEVAAQLNHVASALLIVSGDTAKGLSSGDESVAIPAEWLDSVNTSLAGAVDDAFAAETLNDRIALAGSNERGTLYSAYELLESAGVKFFAPEFDYYEDHAEYVPTSGTIVVPSMNGLTEPSFEFRRKYVEEGWSHTAENLPQLIDWMAKNKLNTLVVPYDYIGQGNTRWDDWRDELIDDLEKRGMIVEVGGHGFESFLTAEKYGQTHPEWFVPGYNVFDIANEEAVDTYVNEVVEYLKVRPEIGIFDSWPPDVATWPPTVLAKFGTSANAYAYVVNKLHEAITEQLPGVRIEAIAYASHVQPPSEEYLYDESVLIDFAPYFRSYRDSVFSPANQSVINQINSWKTKFEGTFTMYEYYRRYAFHSLPIVLPQLIGEELPYYKQFGMEGIGTYSEPGDWITFEITHFILAKMSWNADLNATELIEAYIEARYGGASDDMKTYFQLVEEAGRSIYNSPTGDMNNTTRVTEMRSKYIQAKQSLENAAKAVSGSKESYMIERLLWNIDFSIADVSVDYYRLLGDNASMAASRMQAQDAMNKHRFDGIILQNSYLIREYISGYGNTNWIYDMYRHELKHAPMISTMGTHQSHFISNIVDDNHETLFWSNAAPLVGDYVGVDLQSVQNIKEIQLLMSSSAKPNDYIRNGIVEISSDFEEWETVATLSNQPEASIILEEAAEARFIRIRSTAEQTQWVIIRELKVVTGEIEAPEENVFQTTLDVNPDEVMAGNEIVVKVGLQHIPAPLYALEMTMDYDASLLEYISAQSVRSGLALLNSSNTAGKLRLIAASEGAAHGLEGELELFEITFRAKPVMEDASTVVHMTNAVAGNELGAEVSALLSRADLHIHPISAGIPVDMNKDGKVSIGDLGFIGAHYGKTSESSDWAQIKHADLNKNQIIDLPDLAAVASAIIENESQKSPQLEINED